VILGLVAIICWLVAGWQAVPFGVLLLYAASGPALMVFSTTRQRLKRV
jgi:hypothetical protein